MRVILRRHRMTAEQKMTAKEKPVHMIRAFVDIRIYVGAEDLADAQTQVHNLCAGACISGRGVARHASFEILSAGVSL